MEILSSLTLFSIIFLKEFLLLFYFFLFSDGFYNYFLSLFENKIHPEEIKEEEIPKDLGKRREVHEQESSCVCSGGWILGTSRLSHFFSLNARARNEETETTAGSFFFNISSNIRIPAVSCLYLRAREERKDRD